MSQYGEHDPAAAGRYGGAEQPGYAGGTPGGPVAAAGPPPSTRRAIMLIWASVGLGVISALLSFFLLDDLIDQSLASQPDGTSVNRDTVRAAVIVAVIIGVVISVGIAALFAWLLGKGKNWARIVYTILLVLGAVFGLSGIGGQPALLLVLQLVSLVLSIAIIVLLYQRDSNEFFSRR